MAESNSASAPENSNEFSLCFLLLPSSDFSDSAFDASSKKFNAEVSLSSSDKQNASANAEPDSAKLSNNAQKMRRFSDDLFKSIYSDVICQQIYDKVFKNLSIVS